MPDCTCDFREPRHNYAVGRGPIRKYAVYLDDWEDDTTFDPACPFHGDNGSMVEVVHLKNGLAVSSASNQTDSPEAR